jgi:phosphoribosylglycinamide formyltransferase-1
MTRIAILASGSGSNAESIMKAFENSNIIQISLVISNNSNAGVLARADKFNVPNVVINSAQAKEGLLLQALLNSGADYIVLAGYMKLIPKSIIAAFEKKILNIHPALLPKFGGKGMYGENVHKAVAEAKEKESGITIHFVNNNYDEGAILFQKRVALSSLDSYKEIGAKVLKLEHEFYPQIIEKTILNAAH